LGRRVQIIERAGKGGTINSTENFVYDGLALIQNRNANNAVQQSYFSQGEQWTGGSSAGNYYYTRDHLGSVREFVDATGAVRARYSYDLWGNRTKLSGDLDSNFGFTGYWYHTPSNLYLSPTRPYSAALGRFINRDPIRENGGINLYVYVLNETVYAADPDGLAGPTTVVVQSFISEQNVWGFSGDNRSFSSAPSGAFRTSSSLEFGSETSAGAPYIIQSGTFNQTGISEFLSLPPLQASTNLMFSDVQFSSYGVYQVNMSGQAGDPYFFGFAPPAVFDLTLTLDYNLGTYYGTLTYGAFPSFQVFINGVPVFNSLDTGNPGDLLNLSTTPFSGQIPPGCSP
jgi:RHS repeat-associated protein